TIRGPVEKSLKPFPEDVQPIAYDSVNKTYYGISRHGVVQVDMETKKVKPLELGLDVPRLSWPCEITFDSKRNRVILGSSGGGGYLYAYSPAKNEWSVISKRPRSLDAFVYSPDDDYLYGVLFEHTEAGPAPSLAKVNAEGALVSRVPLGPLIEPGSLNSGPGVTTTQVAIVGKYVAILSAS